MERIQSNLTSQFKICDSINKEKNKFTTIRGMVSKANEFCKNNYSYNGDFWRNIISDASVQDKIAKRKMLGTIEHPTEELKYLNTPYAEASHVVTKAWTDNAGNPWADMLLLNTTQGCQLQALVEVGVPLGVSTRGIGELEGIGENAHVKEEGYVLLGWDIVNNPAVEGLTMTVAPLSDSAKRFLRDGVVEIADMNKDLKIEEIADSIYKKLMSDKSSLINEIKKIIKLEGII